MKKSDIAHIKKTDNGEYKIQSLEDHLDGTSLFAEKFAAEFKNAEWGGLLGLWHDLGKYSDHFQEYIKKNSGYEEDDQKLPKTDHTSAGAIFTNEILPEMWPPLSYCIAGHHAGLLNWYYEIGITGDLQSRLKKTDLLDQIRDKIPHKFSNIKHLNPPCGKKIEQDYCHLWIRMLFSCLVDADFLDTERFMNPESYYLRSKYDTFENLKSDFDKHMSALISGAKQTDVNIIRKNILEECINKAKVRPGYFSLTVPTGGGKTLSSMAWALDHAKTFNKRRIIYAIPYTSIITQTAQVFRDIFGELNVVEHHSNIDEDTVSQERKLAAENWDAPIIVTTNVQLFESLYANKPSRCRKLHNLTNSIIILDEAQMLPPEHLKPILSALNSLVDNFGVTVLFSTATQPVLTGTIGGAGKNSFTGIINDNVVEIISDTENLTKKLQRVRFELPEDSSEVNSWTSIAAELKQYDQALCIVNTRKNCRDLHKLMPDDTIHLSRMMCTAHIMDSIEIIKQKLSNKEPVRVISTQLIEAGVDIDFPVVYRALSGLDSVAQSAGRCNREGNLNKDGKLGLTKIFVPEKQIPQGLMRFGAYALQDVLNNANDTNLLSPEIFKEYFKSFYSRVHNFDKANIETLLCRDAQSMHFQFATAARNFRLIDDKGAVSILVRYKKGSDLIELLKKKGIEPWLMRKLQRYTVTLNQKDFENIRKSGMIEEIHGCWIQTNEILYNSKVGLKFGDEWLEEIHII